MDWKDEIGQLNTAVAEPPKSDWQSDLEKTYARDALFAFSAEAEQQTGAAVMPDEFGKLDLVPKQNDKQYGPTVRAGNIMYISKAFDVPLDTAAGVYESIRSTYFKDKEPVNINLNFIKKRQQDKFLAQSGVNPALWRMSVDFVKGADDGIDWNEKLRTIPEDLRDDFIGYVVENAIPKDRGFWGKTLEAVKRGGIDVGQSLKNWFNYFPQPVESPQRGGIPLDRELTSEQINYMATPKVSGSEKAMESANKSRKEAVFISQANKATQAKDQITSKNWIGKGYFAALRMTPTTLSSYISGSPIAFWYVQGAT